MTVFAPEELMAYHKSGVAAWFAVANPAFQGFEAVVELNTQAARAVLIECEDNLKGALGSANPVEFFTQQLHASQQAVGKAASYARHLVEIAANMQADWTKVTHAEYEHFDAKSKEWLRQFTKHVPAGSEGAVAAMNSAWSTANGAAEMMRAGAAQVIEAAQRGVQAAAAASAQIGQPASPHAHNAPK
ncbi:TIGR01841 family phasin [Burkholderia sp. Ac-20353]|uniref:TIGR01841 family phasin n=1 Tax=Burkholderia sp. Ac-20353 TaxID=2703894 RepID=UPI00197C351A|nr:TIGR01841 family phasin [Burkholderia sp. Ac-20353]MBN3786077.1 TIGR01841 family phasin [Burkholderia sp. Ac-20353]